MGTQLLKDPGIENWTGNITDDWTVVNTGGTLTKEDFFVHGGLFAALMQKNSLAGVISDIEIQQDIAIAAGALCRYGIFVRDDMNLVIEDVTAGKFLSTTQTWESTIQYLVSIPNASYTEFTEEFTLESSPSGDHTIRYRILPDATTSEVDSLADDASLELLVCRGVDDWYYDDTPELRQFSEDQGSLKVIFRPLYNAADVSYLTDSEGNYFYLWEFFVSATNAYKLYYNPASAEQSWNFEQDDGTPVQAKLTSPSPVRGGRIILLARWTGVQNELDVASKQMTLAHLSGGVLTKNTVSISAIGNVNDIGKFRIGQDEGGDFNSAWAHIEEVECVPFVKSDAELIAWAV